MGHAYLGQFRVWVSFYCWKSKGNRNEYEVGEWLLSCVFAPVPLPVLTVVHTVSPSIVHHSWASFFHTNTFTLAKVFDAFPAICAQSALSSCRWFSEVF